PGWVFAGWTDLDFVGNVRATTSDLLHTVHVPGETLTVRARFRPVADLLGIDAPPGTRAGTPFDITVTALTTDGIDVFPAPGYRGTVHFTGTDPGAVLPADYTFTEQDQGRHTFRVSLGTPSATTPQEIRVTDTVTGTLTGSINVFVQPVADLFGI